MVRGDHLLFFGLVTLGIGANFLLGYLCERIFIGHPEEFNCTITAAVAITEVCYDYDPNIRPKPWKGMVWFFFVRHGQKTIGESQFSCGDTENKTMSKLFEAGFVTGGTFDCWYNGGYIDDPRRGILWFGKKHLNVYLFWVGLGISTVGILFCIVGLLWISRRMNDYVDPIDPEKVHLVVPVPEHYHDL